MDAQMIAVLIAGSAVLGIVVWLLAKLGKALMTIAEALAAAAVVFLAASIAAAGDSLTAFLSAHQSPTTHGPQPGKINSEREESPLTWYFSHCQRASCWSGRQDLNLRPLDPQVRKVSAACSGLFFEVSFQYNQPSKGVYGSGCDLAGLYQGDGVGTEVGSE
jgi:hypothetical protein